MAKVYSDNDYSDFLVIEMNGHEASSLNFGFKIPGDLNIIVCGSCKRGFKEAGETVQQRTAGTLSADDGQFLLRGRLVSRR